MVDASAIQTCYWVNLTLTSLRVSFSGSPHDLARLANWSWFDEAAPNSTLAE